jgi:hypothetical protein
MLRVGMPSATLCVVFFGPCRNNWQFAIEEDAERPRRHSHAERGNECLLPETVGPYGSSPESVEPRPKVLPSRPIR